MTCRDDDSNLSSTVSLFLGLSQLILLRIHVCCCCMSVAAAVQLSTECHSAYERCRSHALPPEYHSINPHNTDIIYRLIVPCGLDPRPRFTLCTYQNETDCLYLLELDISYEQESEKCHSTIPQPQPQHP